MMSCVARHLASLVDERDKRLEERLRWLRRRGRLRTSGWKECTRPAEVIGESASRRRLQVVWGWGGDLQTGWLCPRAVVEVLQRAQSGESELVPWVRPARGGGAR